MWSFFVYPPSTTRIYTLSLHDALPILPSGHRRGAARRGRSEAEWLADRLRRQDRKSTRLNSSHSQISYAVFCLKKKKSFAFTTAGSDMGRGPVSIAVAFEPQTRASWLT